MSLITVFTPTYNRAYILPNLYNSLLRQSCKDFEWVIVDDGSTDNTEQLVNGWREESLIDIKYFKQENAGKMQAHNLGVEKSLGKLFVCVDSDDFIVDDAVEIIKAEYDKICQGNFESQCGFITYKGKNKDEVIGNEFPKNVEKTTLSSLYKMGFVGDTTLIFFTDVIKNYSFPRINKEKFLPEAYLYDQIDQSYFYTLLPKILTICEYLEDGLTSNYYKVLFQNPCGNYAYNVQKANYSKSLKEKFLYYVRANSFRKFVKNVEIPVKPNNTFLYNMAFLPGKLLYCIRKTRYKKSVKER